MDAGSTPANSTMKKPGNEKDAKVLGQLIKAVKDQFPQLQDLAIIKYLNTEKNQYFWLTPLEFAKMDETCLKTVLHNIKNLKEAEIFSQ